MGDSSYAIRFTPRRPRSIWSNRNVERVEELTKQGLMRAAGLAAFERRSEARTGVYSAEQQDADFAPAQKRRLRANRKAWKYFQARPPSYRRAATWWVISAKKEETRERRLTRLIEDSEAGRSIPPLTRR